MLDTLHCNLFFHLLPSVGAASYWKLRQHYPDLAQALSVSSQSLQGLLPANALETLNEYHRLGTASAIWQRLEQTIAYCEKHHIHIIHTDHESYPTALSEICNAPPVLYVRGNPISLSLPQIALVGSRHPTPVGRKDASRFAQHLAQGGFVITSGLALGVDGAAHQGCVDVGGRSIAVLGTGVDVSYPKQHRRLAESLLDLDGAVVSEFPLHTGPLAQNFPRRNRIISGLSFGTLVIEAKIKSGSLITARYALEQNREVFALPGSIHNGQSRGCHQLIRQGATLVEKSTDIIDQLRGFISAEKQQIISPKTTSLKTISPKITSPKINAKGTPPIALDSDLEQLLFSIMGFEPTSVDTLAERSQHSVNEVMACLLELELKGLVTNLGSAYTKSTQT